MNLNIIGVLCVAFVIGVPWGFKSLLGLLIFMVFLLTSFLIGFLNEAQSLFTASVSVIFTPISTTNSLPKREFIKQPAGQNSKLGLDKRISGSNLIDDALQDLLQYIIRDHIENWYGVITKETEFLFETKQFLQIVVINVSNRCKEVDWLTFLTTRFFDSVIAHIRLYRETKIRLSQKTSDIEDSVQATSANFVGTFFELEQTRGIKKIGRGRIATNPCYEKESLKILSGFFLQLLSSKEEFNCRPLNLLFSQILTGISFWEALRTCCDVKSLKRSHDFGGEDGIFVKRRLSSLLFVDRVIKNHIQELNEGKERNSIGYNTPSYWKRWVGNHDLPNVELPLEDILKNSVALSYMLDFMACFESQAYIFFLLNAEGWKAAAVQQISQLQLEGVEVKTEYIHSKQRSSDVDLNLPGQILMSLQESAMGIFTQYFSENATPSLCIDDVIVRRLLYNLKNEPPLESWFDEVKSAVTYKLEKDERFLPSFRKSFGYVRMLAELDMLKESTKGDDEDLRSLDGHSHMDSSGLSNHLAVKEKCSIENISYGEICNNGSPTVDNGTLSASICQKGVVKDGISSHAVYSVTVVKSLGAKEIDSWVVYRRYSDFYDFHMRLEERFKAIREFSFPAKRAFNNMDKLFLERRQYLLNEYLSKLLKPEFLMVNPGLRESLLQFLDRGSYEQSKGTISRKVDSLMNPFVSSMRNVTKVVGFDSSFVKENSTNDEILDNLQTLSGIPLYGDGQLPLRFLLILMDEIFDLHNRNQWLRKRVFYVLREILRAMFGDVFNQKIVDYVVTATSPEQVAEFIQVINCSFWPHGVPALPRPCRDEATKMRTRVAAKMSLLSLFSDEIKHLIGSETTREGVFRIFELFQNPVLNRRLFYVIFEAVVDTLFPETNVDELFEKLLQENSN
ncbi:sorting nexin-13 isoform X3 [Daphnia magna]|uniref:sorting nexin-13 isoform X3 n=1 Tax=Daphnia magna TaxID=35525 RepID=UPI001E1BAD02|nr:sorting nexin-13 isoform X3 [Daphnia magna]